MYINLHLMLNISSKKSPYSAKTIIPFGGCKLLHKVVHISVLQIKKINICVYWSQFTKNYTLKIALDHNFQPGVVYIATLEPFSRAIFALEKCLKF